MNKYDVAYLKMAEAFSETSVANRLKVGCVIVRDGQTDPRVRHSEKNALMGLIKSNENAVGATMLCTHACCYFCAIDIVDAGITHFVYKHTYRSDDGLKHLQQNGVIVEQLIDNT